MSNRQIAVLRLHLRDGKVLHNQILSLDAAGRMSGYKTLTAEEPFTEWHRGDWYEA